MNIRLEESFGDVNWLIPKRLGEELKEATEIQRKSFFMVYETLLRLFFHVLYATIISPPELREQAVEQVKKDLKKVAQNSQDYLQRRSQ